MDVFYKHFFYDIFLYVPQNKERLGTSLELKKKFNKIEKCILERNILDKRREYPTVNLLQVFK